MEHLSESVEAMAAANGIVGTGMNRLLAGLQRLKAKREAGEDVALDECHLLKEGTFEVGQLMLHFGNILCRMGDGGVEDPWFDRGYAIHLLLASDRAKEIAESVLEQFAPFGNSGGGGVPREVMESGSEDPN